MLDGSPLASCDPFKSHLLPSAVRRPHPQSPRAPQRLCTVGGFLMVFRLPGMPLGLLGDVLHKWIPDLPPSSMQGQVRWQGLRHA